MNEISARKLTFLFISLCLLTFSVGVAQTTTWFLNPVIVMAHEVAFILLYILVLGRVLPDFASGKGGRLIALLLFLWTCSVTLSFILSPYDLVHKDLAWSRYAETLAHVVFAFYVWSFLHHYRGRTHLLLLMLPAASAIVIAAFVFTILTSELDSLDLFHTPVLNSHIRHTGYQLAAALAVLVAFLLNREYFRKGFVLFLCLSLLWTGVFWTGGRAAALAMVAVVLLFFALCKYRRLDSTYAGNMLIGSLLTGLLFSELLAVFPWNGVLQGLYRTMDAENLNQFSTGRLAIWQAAWDSVKSNLMFGLGPQGYYFMPNRIYGVQPHTVVLQFITEWGIVGSLLFVPCLILAFVKGGIANVFSVKRLSVPQVAAGMVIVVLTVHSIVDGTYYHPQPSFYLALAFAIWLTPAKEGERPSSSKVTV